MRAISRIICIVSREWQATSKTWVGQKGFESLYNVFVMDETHTILACGSGGVTKLKNQSTDHLERIFNFKYPYEYIDRFDEIIERKSGILRFYGQ